MDNNLKQKVDKQLAENNKLKESIKKLEQENKSLREQLNKSKITLNKSQYIHLVLLLGGIVTLVLLGIKSLIN